MIDLLVFLFVIAAIIRTVIYGVWLFKSKNALGGVFVLTLSLIALSLGAYISFMPGF